MQLTWNLAWFAGCLVFFHTSEVCLAAIYMRDELGWSSLLLSKAYVMAMSTAILEHLCWTWLAPALHNTVPIAALGVLLIIAGEGIRKSGMITAGRAFTHVIRRTRHPDHQLVQHGVYRHVRHPGYLGWLMWAVGTQLLLVNPCCTILFAVTACRFFQRRIAYEEWLLEDFFGDAYLSYKQRTPTYIPGVP